MFMDKKLTFFRLEFVIFYDSDVAESKITAELKHCVSLYSVFFKGMFYIFCILKCILNKMKEL